MKPWSEVPTPAGWECTSVSRQCSAGSAQSHGAAGLPPPLADTTRTLAECLQADQPIIRVALMLARQQGLSASFMTQAALPSAQDIEAELGPDLLQQARDMVADQGAPQTIERAVRDIGLALSAAHGTIATDLPEAEVTDTSWRVDHTHAMAQLAVLAKALDASSGTCP